MPGQHGRIIIAAPTEYDAGISTQPLAHQIEEVAEIVQAFYEPVALLRRVDDDRLFEELRKGASAFWFAGHSRSGVGGGILLSNGIVSMRRVARYLHSAGVGWSYINSCDSGALIEELQAVHQHDVFANILPDMLDEEAAENGRLFAQGIADSGNILTAYRWVVVGGPSALRLFPSPRGDGVIREREEPARERSLEDKSELDKRIRRLEQIVLGDQDIGLPSLGKQYEKTNTRLFRIEISSLILVALLGFYIYLSYAEKPLIQTIVVVATPTPGLTTSPSSMNPDDRSQ